MVLSTFNECPLMIEHRSWVAGWETGGEERLAMSVAPLIMQAKPQTVPSFSVVRLWKLIR